MSSYTALKLDEMDSVHRGAFVRARASLGVTSFGMQIITLPPNNETGHPKHDEKGSRQEEVYVVLSGSGNLVIDDVPVPIDPETFVRVAPEAMRVVHAGHEGVRFMCIGGVPGEAYEAPAFTEISKES